MMIPNYASQNQQNPSFWDQLPFFFKFLVIITLLNGLIGLITTIIIALFINFPYYTIFYVNIWRLFTTSLVPAGIISGLLSLIIIYFFLPKIQKKISTTILIVDFFIINALVQLIYSIIWIPFYYYNKQENIKMYSNGLLIMWMVMIVRICYADPESDIKLCCLPYNLKKKFYPFLILLLITVLNFAIPYDFIIAAILAFIECRFFNSSFIKLNRTTYQTFESSFLLNRFNTRSDYFTLSGSDGSRYFCRNEENDRHVQFYTDVMNQQGNNNANEGNNNMDNNNMKPYNYAGDTQITSNQSNLSNMKGGITINAGIKPVVTLEDIRNHWATKDTPNTNNVDLIETQQKDKQQIKIGQQNKKNKNGYTVFDDEN